MDKNKRIKSNRELDLIIISRIQRKPFIYTSNLPGHFDKKKRLLVFNEIAEELNDTAYCTGAIIESRWKSFRTKYSKLQKHRKNTIDMTDFEYFVWQNLYFLKTAKKICYEDNNEHGEQKDCDVEEKINSCIDNHENPKNDNIIDIINGKKQCKINNNSKSHRKASNLNPMMEITNCIENKASYNIPLLSIKKEVEDESFKPAVNNLINQKDLTEIIVINSSDEDEDYRTNFQTNISSSKIKINNNEIISKNLEIENKQIFINDTTLNKKNDIDEQIPSESSQVESNLLTKSNSYEFSDDMMDIQINDRNIEQNNEEISPYLELKTSASGHVSDNEPLLESQFQSDTLFDKYEIVSNNVKLGTIKNSSAASSQSNIQLQTNSDENAICKDLFANEKETPLLDSVFLADGLLSIKTIKKRMKCLTALKAIMKEINNGQL